MKTMIYATLVKVFERGDYESIEEFLEFYKDIESTLLKATKSNLKHLSSG